MSDARSLADLVVAQSVAPASATNTAGATTPSGKWVAVAGFIGDIAVVAQVGAVTAGSITGNVQEADDATGTNAQNIISGGAFAALTAAGQQVVAVNRNVLRKPFIGYAGTVVTGPALVSVSIVGRNANV
jgi:hypothetical protein